MRREAVEYWDAMASANDDVTRSAILTGFRSEEDFNRAGEEDVRHLVLPYIAPTDVVLDVGCGIGRLLRAVHPHCKQVVGLDVSSEMLRKARQRLASADNVRLLRLPRSLRFPLEAGTIDYVYFYHVSEHLTREDTFRILQQMRRCMRPRGKALIEFALFAEPENLREFRKWARLGDPEGVRSRFYTEEEALLLLRMVGLFPQIRLYVPGELVVVATRLHSDVQGAMPQVLPGRLRER